MNKKITILITVCVLILFGVALYFYYKTNTPQSTPFASPSESVSINLTITPTPSPTGSIEPTGTPIKDVIPKCYLNGQVVYEGGSFLHIDDQEFHYSDLYDPHDIINWSIFPSGEDFSIGPNRASGLKLGSGSDFLTISFKGLVPKHDTYSLSASIDYVATVGGGAKILNEKCSGTTKLVIKK
ncbi:MAG: hypothetical protein UT43_C0014G0002 [Parcubacteria group bacterium GW2011_GWC1_39_29]|uniref:Uncharacterized protein n=1 Tax=Candidatus Yanofskybacteria bacterium GW2011_GWD1_39_16 TaxID=1619030 RepID=A0A837HS80_9BACT|nr:MAG: hypothetical protein UT35_C0010G0002 [Candidatus Yanofskybacteria bacterium GW2011_GWD1_39_16]KKR14848.1 MAG: hypothetical protein UT43_C0014G0002 [Parcubacteria group bacterium GW2011_GWC1_39_29]